MRPAVTSDSGTDRKIGSSELCLACGLCCNGTLHSTVIVRAEHVPLVRSLGLTIGKTDGDKPVFRQPCPLHQNDRCSVYPHHPPTCQEYRCALLEKYEDGRVTLETSKTIVGTAKELLASGTERLIVGDEIELQQSWDVALGLLGSDGRREANAELLLRAVALKVHFQKHFRQPTKESDRAESRPRSMVGDAE